MTSEIKRNFSENASRVYNRFMYAASASIFVSTLDLSPTNSFFGIKVENFNERWIEFAFLLATLLLGWSYFTRVMDERRVLFGNLNEVADQTKVLKSLLKEMDGWNHEFSLKLEKNKLLYARPIDSVERKIESITNSITSIENNENVNKEDIQNLKRSLFSILEEHKKYIVLRQRQSKDITNLLNTTIPGVLEKLKPFELKLHSRTVFTDWARIRVVSIDFVVPVITMLFCLLCFLFPNNTPPEILSEIQNFFTSEKQ